MAKILIYNQLTCEKSTILMNFCDSAILGLGGTLPIPGFGIGENGWDSRIWDNGIVVPTFSVLGSDG